jgi:hypothetical protein
MSTWRWNRYNANMANTVSQKVDDPTIPARLDAIIANPSITDGDKNFASSLKLGWEKYKSLTANQFAAFERMEKRYDPAVVKQNTDANNDWKASFDANKRGILNACANYYITTAYFRDIAVKVIADPNWIPSEKQYRAMCENKYAQRLIDNINTPPKFNPSDLVSVRKTSYRFAYRFDDYLGNGNKNVAIILEVGVAGDVVKGSREYKVMFVGDDMIETITERELKKYREAD